MVDLEQRTFLRKLPAGSDPEEFAVSKDGPRLYISNEDVATASVVDVANGKVEQIVRVKKEPEGVAISPDGRFVYVTCETGGEVVVIDARPQRRSPRSPSAAGPGPSRSCRTARGRSSRPRRRGPSRVVDTRRFAKLEDDRAAGGLAADGDALGRAAEAALRQHRPGGDGLRRRPGGGAGRARRSPWGSGPGGSGISPDGKTLFVANGPSNDVSVIDLDDGQGGRPDQGRRGALGDRRRAVRPLSRSIVDDQASPGRRCSASSPAGRPGPGRSSSSRTSNGPA